jgi:glycosyltransferase involved in cell wall biosynthesis
MAAALPLVTVVTPCYVGDDRQLALLDDTLATVGAQTHAPHELLVVDDGRPTQGVADVVARHAGARALRQANAGPAAARNRAIAEARGEFLVFLDADDHLYPHALAAALAAFAEHPASAMVVGPRDDMAFDGTALGWEWQPPLADPDFYRTLLRFDWYIIPPSSVMVRRDVARAVGGFRDPWGADDLDFYLRVVRQHPVACFGGPPSDLLSPLPGELLARRRAHAPERPRRLRPRVGRTSPETRCGRRRSTPAARA